VTNITCGRTIRVVKTGVQIPTPPLISSVTLSQFIVSKRRASLDHHFLLLSHGDKDENKTVLPGICRD